VNARRARRVAVDVACRVLVPVLLWVAVGIGLAALLGFVTWVGALAMWLVLAGVVWAQVAARGLGVDE